VANKRAKQGPSRPDKFARYMVAKGFVVIAPTRIGYSETYGAFDPEDSGGCSTMRIDPMSVAASDQVLATYEYAKTLPYVNASKWIVAGTSVGGLTAVATVGRHPPNLIGGINFAGGTGGNPDTRPENPCNPGETSRYWSIMAQTATVPMLWLYWENDKYWGPNYPKGWHQAWIDNGGKAQMHTLPPSGTNGHFGFNDDMKTWTPIVDQYLEQIMRP
jgi:dienelactone hydrolase